MSGRNRRLEDRTDETEYEKYEVMSLLVRWKQSGSMFNICQDTKGRERMIALLSKS